MKIQLLTLDEYISNVDIDMQHKNEEGTYDLKKESFDWLLSIVKYRIYLNTPLTLKNLFKRVDFNEYEAIDKGNRIRVLLKGDIYLTFKNGGQDERSPIQTFAQLAEVSKEDLITLKPTS